MRSEPASLDRMPHADPIRVRDRDVPAHRVLELLAAFVSEERRTRIREAVEGRTYSVASVIEGVFNRGNVNAVMRTAEGLGFQAFHILRYAARFKHSPRTALGADKWLDVWRWDTATACVGYLHSRGYRIVATHPEASAPLSEFDFTRPTALVFGNETDGVSEAMLRLADARCTIPMSGLSRSFNVSVAAAIALYHAYQDRLRRIGKQGDLSESERRVLEAIFTLRSVQHHERILSRLLDEQG